MTGEMSEHNDLLGRLYGKPEDAELSVRNHAQAATDRIADPARRLLTRETTFAELCMVIREELQAMYETGQQEGARDSD